MDNSNWCFERDAEGHGVVKHAPRHAPPVQCWKDAGSGDVEDSLHIFGFQWIDRRPDFADFDRLMQEAATAIDAWIANRL